ncbi:hypothetical protein MRX96_014209 [Rhipicephalus microplus]
MTGEGAGWSAAGEAKAPRLWLQLASPSSLTSEQSSLGVSISHYCFRASQIGYHRQHPQLHIYVTIGAAKVGDWPDNASPLRAAATRTKHGREASQLSLGIPYSYRDFVLRLCRCSSNPVHHPAVVSVSTHRCTNALARRRDTASAQRGQGRRLPADNVPVVNAASPSDEPLETFSRPIYNDGDPETSLTSTSASEDRGLRNCCIYASGYGIVLVGATFKDVAKCV